MDFSFMYNNILITSPETKCLTSPEDGWGWYLAHVLRAEVTKWLADPYKQQLDTFLPLQCISCKTCFENNTRHVTEKV